MSSRKDSGQCPVRPSTTAQAGRPTAVLTPRSCSKTPGGKCTGPAAVKALRTLAAATPPAPGPLRQTARPRGPPTPPLHPPSLPLFASPSFLPPPSPGPGSIIQFSGYRHLAALSRNLALTCLFSCLLSAFEAYILSPQRQGPAGCPAGPDQPVPPHTPPAE